MLICIEGNIGCGKSTALQALQAKGFKVFQEPVEEWSPLLAKFYDDQARWALALSVKVLLSFLTPHAHHTAGGQVVVVERSPLSCRHVFGQLLFNESKMTQDEWTVFKECFDLLGWKPDVLVYVDTPAEECCARISRRGRPEEAGIDAQYVRRLEFQYETMLRYCDVPVVRVDGTKSPDQVADDIEALLLLPGQQRAGQQRALHT